MKASNLRGIAVLLFMALTLGLFTLLPLTVTAEAPEISGDASRLTVDKSTYIEGEPIMVAGVGTGADWVGIYREGAPHSIRWFYVDTAKGGPGSGVAVNIRQVPDVNAGEPVTLPVGTYVIRLMPDDSSDLSRVISWTTITIVANPEAEKEVPPPASASYTLTGEMAGFATGTVSVTMADGETKDRSIVMYWADDNGKLKGYTSLAKFKVTGKTTEYTFGQNVIIPAGATKLLVYALNDSTGVLSASCVTVELPDGAAHKPLDPPLDELWIMSDIHITTDQNHVHNKNFAQMLKDVQAVSKDALGIFVVGDMADTGKEVEYQNMTALYSAAGQLPPLFLAIGNHDLSALPFDQANALFLKYATLPDGSHPTDTSYDFWLGGYHFIFLGTDVAAGLHSSFNRDTMTWLKEKLDENRDPNRPAFVFLHQSLSDTVSGSLPGEGWSGVDNEGMLRNVLKKYPEVMFFNGHSHWTMDSVGNMYEGTSKLPCRIFNCASVAYLWSGYNVVTGEHLDGSQGYLVKLYDGKLYVLGRDFARGEWIPSAQYCIVLKEEETETEPVTEATTDPVDPPEDNTVEEVPTTAQSETDPTEPNESTAGAQDTTPAAESGCGAVISLASLSCLALLGFGITFFRKKEQ